MQFRVQGKKIQCIRSVYDPDLQRCRQKLVISFDYWLKEPPPEVLADGVLEPEEQAQLRQWLDHREEVSRKAGAGLLVEQLPGKLAHVAGLVAEISAAEKDDPMAKHQPTLKQSAPAIWEQIKALESGLKKAGFEKPRRKYRRKK